MRDSKLDLSVKRV